MKLLLRSLSLLIAITCVVWVAVLWRWQTTHDDLSPGDVALYLGALPLALFTVAMTARWAFSGLDERAAKRQASRVAAATPQAAPARTAGEAELMATMHLLCAAINCAAGNTPQAVAAAIGEQRPGLDRELVDDDGLPVMAARIDGLDATMLSPPLGIAENLAQRRDATWASLETSAPTSRALAALAPCLDAVFAALVPWRERLGVKDGSEHDDGMHSDNGTRMVVPAAPSRVLVYVAWPNDATPFDRAVADLWLQRAIDERRTGIVGAGRIVRPPAEPTSSGPALLRHADEAMVRMRRESAPNDLVLLLAAESHIAEPAVQRWRREGLLYGSRNPKGRIPGEAAAALLLAPVAWSNDDDAATAVLHRPPIGARDKPVDGAGRIDAKLASSMAEQALAVAGLEPAAIAAIVSDADQATPRGLETHAVVHGLLSHLDAGADVASTGVACGHVGAPSTLIAIALAAHRSLDENKPCLALSVGDPLARTAIVARPCAPASTAASATPTALG